jgi:hypothetical protein
MEKGKSKVNQMKWIGHMYVAARKLRKLDDKVDMGHRCVDVACTREDFILKFDHACEIRE